MMNDVERMEMEAELNGREDYRREAFGGEVRALELQALDDRAAGAGFTNWVDWTQEEARWASKSRAAKSIRRGKEARGFRLPVNPDNDIPF